MVNVFGAARPHNAYLLANRRANRIKALVHDGIGVWQAARRLNSGKFVWPKDAGTTLTLTRAQFDVLILGQPGSALAMPGSSRALKQLRDVPMRIVRHDRYP